MLFLSILFGVGGLAAERIYTSDWWRPLTITHTTVGIEDFLFGFWVAGIAAVIYEEIFKKRIYKRKIKQERPFFHIGLYCVLLLVIFHSSFFFFKINSFYSSIVGFVPLTIVIWIKRKDLIWDSLATGFLILFIGFLWFWIPEFFTPGWVKNYWLLNNLSGIIILKAPLEDLVWGFIAGMFIGPLYEFWQGSKLIAYNPRRKNQK